MSVKGLVNTIETKIFVVSICKLTGIFFWYNLPRSKDIPIYSNYMGRIKLCKIATTCTLQLTFTLKYISLTCVV